MKNPSRLPAISAALGMLLLILDSKTALHAAQDGAVLCLRTVVPALFPFFVLSTLLTCSVRTETAGWLRPLESATGIPRGAGSILLAGHLGGYPIGAKCIGEACQQGRISRQDAARMMAFCNNAGPAFIFGIAGPMFSEKWAGLALWGIQILSSLTVGAILPGKSSEGFRNAKTDPITATDAVNRATKAMAAVCSWVLLFRVILAILDRWLLWILPAEVSITVSGLLELTNGCCSLGMIRDPSSRFVLCAGILAFGGLCVGMQTTSVASGVSLKWYLPGKLLQTALAVSMALAMTETPYVLGAIAVVVPLLIFCSEKAKNRCRISRRIGV